MIHRHIYILQVLFATGITLGAHSLDFQNKHTSIYRIAQYVVYILTIKYTKTMSVLVYELLHRKKALDTKVFNKVNRNRLIIYLIAVAVLYLSYQKLYTDDMPLMLIAYLAVKYPEMDTIQECALVNVEPKLQSNQLNNSAIICGTSEIAPAINLFQKSPMFKQRQHMNHCKQKPTQLQENDLWNRNMGLIGTKSPHRRKKQACHSVEDRCETHQGPSTVSLGVGLACSYMEGHLDYIIPPDGSYKKSLHDNIRTFEDQHNVVFPVKRMFIIVTKTLYCPTDLKEFNDKSDRTDVNRLEACLPFESVWCEVAGARRSYHSAAYKIVRAPHRPVYVAAEGVSSLHTLYKVLNNSRLRELMSGVCVNEVVTDFICTLRSALRDSPDFKNTCEIVYFDDTNGSLNLSDVLLNRISELEPNFEHFISSRR